MNKIYILMETRTTWENGDYDTPLFASADKDLCKDVGMRMKERWKRREGREDYSLHYWVKEVDFFNYVDCGSNKAADHINLDELSIWN